MELTPDLYGSVDGLQQYELVWLYPDQLPAEVIRPHGAAVEIVDFLGRGDPDSRGQATVWVRGPVVEVVHETGRVRLVRGVVVTVAIPHDQQRARDRSGMVDQPEASEVGR